MENIRHNVLQPRVHLFKRPREAQANSGSFQRPLVATPPAFAAPWPGPYSMPFASYGNGLGRRGMLAPSHTPAAVCGQLCGAFTVYLILRCAGKRNIARNAPNAGAALALVFRAGHFLHILADARAAWSDGLSPRPASRRLCRKYSRSESDRATTLPPSCTAFSVA